MPKVEKKCFKCREVKPVLSFYRNRSRSDGYADNCRECQAEYRRLTEEKNPGVVREYNRVYYKANRTRRLAQHRDHMRRKTIETNRARLVAAEEIGLPLIRTRSR